MLDELFEIHHQVMKTTPLTIKRYLYEQVHWDSRAICFTGGRGVGKTTLMCQRQQAHYKNAESGLYITADNIHVASFGLFNIAREYFKYGGQALFIDEVHKYPNWTQEVKNILDTYKEKQLVISASSTVELNKSKFDLSRRVVYHELKGLSFREYLQFTQNISAPALSLEELLENHAQIASNLSSHTILKYFNEYLRYGYYPFFMEGTEDYYLKINNVIEKIIFEDIATVYNLKHTTIIALRKILWLIATSKGLVPNIDKISKNLQISREVVYSCLDYLELAGLTNSIKTEAAGMKYIRKPGKALIENTSLHFAINNNIKTESEKGTLREIFFVNQLKHQHSVKLHETADFIVDHKYIFEVGGASKKTHQIRNEDNAFLAIDDREIGVGNRIPLYLFGFLY